METAAEMSRSRTHKSEAAAAFTARGARLPLRALRIGGEADSGAAMALQEASTSSSRIIKCNIHQLQPSPPRWTKNEQAGPAFPGASAGLGGHHCRRAPGAVALARFASSRISGRLEDHFNLRPASIFTSAPRVKSDTSPTAARPAPTPAKPACERMTGADPGNRANGSAGWNRDLRGLSLRYASLSLSCSMVPSPSLYVLLAGAGQAVYHARNLHHGAIRKNDRSKVHVELRFALHTCPRDPRGQPRPGRIRPPESSPGFRPRPERSKRDKRRRPAWRSWY